MGSLVEALASLAARHLQLLPRKKYQMYNIYIP